MTDRIKGFYVVLEREMREDDAESLLNAVRCMRNVLAVSPSVENADDWMNRSRVYHELRGRLWKALEEK